MKKRYLLLIISVLVGVGLSVVDSYTQAPAVAASDEQSSEPDFYGEGLKSRRYGTEGQLNELFTADSSKHYPANDHTVFTKPYLHAMTSSGDVWFIDAETGDLFDKAGVLHLRQNVWLRTAQTKKMPAHIRTDALDYHLNDRLALTDKAVSIEQGQSTLSAIGMRMDIPQERIEFNAKVFTHYDQH